MSRLSESDDSLPVGGKWENMEFHSLPFPSSYSNSEHILISTLKVGLSLLSCLCLLWRIRLGRHRCQLAYAWAVLYIIDVE